MKSPSSDEDIVYIWMPEMKNGGQKINIHKNKKNSEIINHKKW
jgi:hypothetical protein